jgi:ribonuclease P protein component
MPKPSGQGIYLRASRDIESVKRQGRRFSTGVFNLMAYKADDIPSRVGIVVGRRFGNAVRRNRVKRVFRELVRELYEELIPGHSIVIFPKREALVESFEGLKRQWLAVLDRAHLRRRLT